MTVKRAVLLFLLGMYCAAGMLRVCQAQPPDSATLPPANDPAVGQEVGDGPNSLPEPWRHWKIHSGTPTECVATVHVDAQGGQPAFTVSGLVVRCDGFVLVPRSAYERLKVKGATGSVSVIGAEGETISAPIPLAGWQYAPADGRYPDYGLVKINNHHVRCLPLLSANVIQKDLAVDIVFATDDSKPGLCIAHSYTAGVMRVPEGNEHTSRNPEHFALVNIRTEGKAPSDGNVDDAAAIPMGAVVIDHESGAAIGMVTATGTQPHFATMAQFSRIFNDVAVAPSRSSIAYHHRKDSSLPEGMILVPGGPTKLYGNVGGEYRSNFGTDVVCMPDFQVDIFPVTNQQFRDWLAGPGGGATWPRDWPLTEVNSPVRRGDLPVLGVPSESARAYASDQDKRLLTEAEWQRASLIYKVPTNVKPETQTNAFLFAYRTVSEKIIGIMQQRAATAALMPQSNYSKRPSEDAAYNLMHSPLPPDLLGEYRSLQTQANDLAPSGGIFGEVHPVSTYLGDVSFFGVRDVLSNAVELLLNKGRQDCLSPTKVFQANVDPYTTYIGVAENGVRANHYFIDIMPTAGIYFLDRVVVDAGLEPPSFGIAHESFMVDATGLPFSYSYALVGSNNCFEFRCAR